MLLLETAFLPFLLGQLRFARAKVTGIMGNLLDPLASTDGEITHLYGGTAFAVLLCPAVVERSRDARSRTDKDDRALGVDEGPVQT